jgi:hypothetical protein
VIVRQAGDALQLITQPAHAALAGAIMQDSVALADHPRRSSILLAVAEHDNGWTESDAAPLIDPATGVPLDFMSAPIAVRQSVWPRGVARLSNDPWAAALVAQHAIVIFDRYRGDAAWTRFFGEMETVRRAMLDAAGLPLQELVADYRFLGLGDLISLTFCNGWTEVQRFDTWTVRLSGPRLFVCPDLFGGNTREIGIEARQIRQRTFHSDAELRDILAAAPITTLNGMIVGSPPSFTTPRLVHTP